MDSSMHDMFYKNALLGLMNGCLMPWDKEVLSAAPLPSSVIEPYMSKEVPDVRESMRLTYETMVVWIEEARKVNYFSKRFVQLSKMIMNGVTAMGRGLITLHARGEELSGVPMSIEDLIGVASYHFRKSHLGVLQTVRSHPEISERLLMNQIGWNNMLMRLFKTREKLSQKSEIRNKKSEINGQCSVASGIENGASKNSGCLPSEEKNLMLPDAKDAGFDPFKVFCPEDRGLAEPAAIREPDAFTAPRAFSSYDNKKPVENMTAEIRNKKSTYANTKTIRENAEGRSKKEEIIRVRENEEEIKGKQQNEVTDQESEDEKNLKENQIGRDNETERDLPKSIQDEPPIEAESSESPLMEESPNVGTISDDTPSDRDRENNPEKANFPNSRTIPEDTPSEYKSGDHSVKGESPGGEDNPVSDLPIHLQILKNVCARSGETEENKLIFTYAELCILAADPDFNRIYPDQAAQMRSILLQMEESG